VPELKQTGQLALSALPATLKCLFYGGALGVMSMTAFAPYHAWYVLPLCLGVLLRLALQLSMLQAALLGFAYGLAQFLLGLHWVYSGLLQQTSAQAWLAASLYIILAAACAAFPALILAFTRSLQKLPQTIFCLTIASLWTLSEMLRGELGMPLLSTSLAMVDAPWANLAGVIGGTGLTWSCALLATLSFRPHLAIIGLSVCMISSWLMPEWSTQYPSSLKVRLMQGHLSQQEKASPVGILRALQTYTELSDMAEVDLLVTPETAIPLSWQKQGEQMHQFWQTLSKQNQAVLLLGTYSQHDSANPGSGQTMANYNSAYAIFPDGKSPYRYDKVRLAFLGEYLPPYLTWLGRILSADFSNMQAGAESQAPLRIAGLDLSLSICFESFFPRRKSTAYDQPELMLNLSNFAWFADSLVPEQALQALRLRALENERWLMLAENSGFTSLISPKGQVVAQLSKASKAYLEVRVPARQGLTPYTRYGQWEWLLLCFILFLNCTFYRCAYSDSWLLLKRKV